MADEKREVLAYPPTAILKTEEVAEWLAVDVTTVREYQLPRLRLPGKNVRYSAGQVLAYLEGRLT